MKKTSYSILLISLLCAATPMSCVTESSDDCDNSGCDATNVPASGYSIETGIAGSAAARSDVETNGCYECLLAGGDMLIFNTEEPIASFSEAQALVDSGAVPEVLSIDETYEHELVPGEYLICSDESEAVCEAVTINDNEVITVHLTYFLGSMTISIFLPGEDTKAQSGAFPVNMP